METDDELIAKIKAQRQIRKQTQNIIGDLECVTDNKTASGVTWKVPAYPYVRVALSNGERWYIRLRSEQYLEHQVREYFI